MSPALCGLLQSKSRMDSGWLWLLEYGRSDALLVPHIALSRSVCFCFLPIVAMHSNIKSSCHCLGRRATQKWIVFYKEEENAAWMSMNCVSRWLQTWHLTIVSLETQIKIIQLFHSTDRIIQNNNILSSQVIKL